LFFVLILHNEALSSQLE